MNYDVLVKGFRLKSARMVVAHLLAREENVPLHQALAMLNDLPRPLFRNVGSDEIGARLEQYRKLGVELDAVESRGTVPEKPREEPPPAPPVRHAPPVQPAAAPHAHASVAPAGAGESGPGRGVPLKDFLIVNEPAARRPKDRRALWSWIICGALVAALAAAFVAISRVQRRPAAYGVTAVEPGGGAAPAAGTEAGATVTVAARAMAAAYDDSARACGSNAEAAIRFYRLAIAFNRNNIHAWFGLLDACRAAGRTEEAEQARREMEKQFGATVFSAEKILKEFGTPLEYHRESDGALYVEYRSKSGNDRGKLLREAYLVARELRSSGAGASFSLFASTSPACGLVAHCGSDVNYGSVEEFEAGATIYFFDKSKKQGE